MKIGIITIFDAYNYGSFLQAFAMQTFLKEKGHEVFLIDVRETLKSRISQKYLAKSVSRTILKLRRFFNYRKDWKMLHITSKSACPELDLCIIGSDEVWNIENPSFDHSLLFYGTGIKSKDIIAYAPSLGYSTIESYKDREDLLSSIKSNISWFGARDGFTESFLHTIGVNHVQRICDPTILLYDKWRLFETERIVNEPYLIYYSYQGNTPFEHYIKRFAQEKGLKIISVGFDYKWCDLQIIASPREFLSLIRGASYVVTSTFHGTLFSTMYEKKFIEVHPARKVIDFLEQIGLNKIPTLEDGYVAFRDLLEENIDYERIKKLFGKMRNHSVEALTLNKPI